jgi:hypothetical protein
VFQSIRKARANSDEKKETGQAAAVDDDNNNNAQQSSPHPVLFLGVIPLRRRQPANHPGHPTFVAFPVGMTTMAMRWRIYTPRSLSNCPVTAHFGRGTCRLICSFSSSSSFPSFLHDKGISLGRRHLQKETQKSRETQEKRSEIFFDRRVGAVERRAE